jgi:hypothetical protein
MKTDDDDFLTADVPDPDAEPTAAERAHAKAFADLVDKAIASGRLPPAMSADDRALLEVATVIRASTGGMSLAPSKQASVIEGALRQAIGGTNAAATSLSSTPVVSIRSRRWVPWAVASASSLVAAAAIVMLVVRKPTVVVTPTAAEVPMSWKSRPSDPLIGRISHDCGKPAAGEGKAGGEGQGPRTGGTHDRAQECAREATAKASSRIDSIFDDRLDGYRDRQFARRGGQR